MERSGIFENGGVRRFFAAFAAVAAAYLLLSGIFIFAGARRTEQRLALREQAVAGRLIAGGASAGDVAAAFSGADPSYAAAGAAALEKAGYTEKTAGLVFPDVAGAGKLPAGLVLAAGTVSLSLCAFFAFMLLNEIYDSVNRAGRQAGLVARGDFGARLPENGEGAFARMDHAFNEMVSGVAAGEEKQRRERLFLKNLISDISHQLKTPLAALKMYNEILEKEKLERDAADFVEQSRAQLERMEWLILGLLKMARFEAGCYDLKLCPAPLTEVAALALGDYAPAAAAKGVETRLLSHGGPVLRCDPGWLREAVGNVVKNCIEYTPPGGQVTVAVDESPVMVSLKVTDTGKGIDPDDLPFVFRRFYRGRACSGPGSGIGLCLSKSIVEQMGGTLAAGGEYGRGAEFCFSFLREVI